ncbi:MAG: hypothetical protein Q8R16_04100 [bacterium]|nr:hypothetical protein [bacterium]
MPALAPQSQKSVLGGLIAFGILAIVLGMLQLQRAIRPTRSVTAGSVPTIPRTREELEALQRAAIAGLDTDRDGLSDLDELEMTQTSPFLADSDSDGKNDKEEVDAGEDPNCPKGKMCGSSVRPETVVRPVVPSLDLSDTPTVGSPSLPASSSGAHPVTADPIALRRALERQGIPAAILDQLTDEQLMTSYGSMLGSISTTSTGELSPFTDALRSSFSGALLGDGETGLRDALAALPQTPPAIRAALLRGGFPQEELRKLDDATLLKVWKQVIEDLKKQPPQPATP